MGEPSISSVSRLGNRTKISEALANQKKINSRRI